MLNERLWIRPCVAIRKTPRNDSAAAEEAEGGEDLPALFFYGSDFSLQTLKGKGRQYQENDGQASCGRDAGRDLVAHRARHDPVARPQQQGRQEHEVGDPGRVAAHGAC
jgi:hypothetical protein